MIPIITPSIMLEEETAWDIQNPIERIETSGKALFESILSHLHPHDHLLFCVGKGLNGADTLCLALHCIEAGFEVSVMCLYETAELKEETKYFYEKINAFEKTCAFALPSKGRYVIIDGIFGAGFKNDVNDAIQKAFQAINASLFPIYSIDIPSGISGESGAGIYYVNADVTLSIGLPKWGLFVKQGRQAAGHIKHVEIGLQKQISTKKALGFFLNEDSLYSLFPKEKPFYHKYQRGQVLGIASHTSYRGASYFYTKAAYRSGAGLVRLFHEAPEHFFPDLTPEVTQHTYQDFDKFAEKRHVASVIGPGLVVNPNNIAFAKKILEKRLPCVLDGGAFELIHQLKLHPEVVLTPHLDELKKVLKTDSSDFDELVKQATNHLLQTGLTLVIKGHHTWILHQDKKPIICTMGPPAMATAGSGDVLSGMIGAFLAKSSNSFKSAILGVGLHALAGTYAVMNQSKKAIMASDILDAMGEAFSVLD